MEKQLKDVPSGDESVKSSKAFLEGK